jgi:Arc/MetJ-type ribon-helix-helix transcriptional regulator
MSNQENRPCDGTAHLNRHVEIPERTAIAIEERLEGTEFDSVDEYVAFALTVLLENLDSQEEAHDPEDGEAGTVENEAVRDRLETLGYL